MIYDERFEDSQCQSFSDSLSGKSVANRLHLCSEIDYIPFYPELYFSISLAAAAI